MPNILEEICDGCGMCIDACSNDAITIENNKAFIINDLCLGCGVCVSMCPNAGIKLESRLERVLTPVSTAHRTVVMAIERGMLQNLIFDNQAMSNHRAMAAILGVILKLPPIKQAMVSQQMKSRYLEALLSSKLVQNAIK